MRSASYGSVVVVFTISKHLCGVPGISVQFFTTLPGGYWMISVPFFVPQTFAS